MEKNVRGKLTDIEIEIALLMEAIYRKYHYDFRDYAFASVQRRIQSALPQLNCLTVSALTDRLMHEPAVFPELLQYLTIPTSEMFRDPGYFLAIREKVVPILKTYPSLRIWIAGCSHGEEVYSLAIVLKEEGLLDRTQIYATDINPKSLERAKEGIFLLEDLKKYEKSYHLSGGKELLSNYYVANYDAVQMDRSLVKNAVFADHSLATDSPFAEMQFISCRNVLIYFNRNLQDRAFGLFRDSLAGLCFLGLGSRETLRFSKHAPDFEPFVSEERIYRKLGRPT